MKFGFKIEKIELLNLNKLNSGAENSLVPPPQKDFPDGYSCEIFI